MQSRLFCILFPLFSHLSLTQCDAPETWQMSFQDPATPIMQGIIDLHHDIMFFVVVINIFVLWMLVRTLQIFSKNVNPQPETITSLCACTGWR